MLRTLDALLDISVCLNSCTYSSTSLLASSGKKSEYRMCCERLERPGGKLKWLGKLQSQPILQLSRFFLRAVCFDFGFASWALGCIDLSQATGTADVDLIQRSVGLTGESMNEALNVDAKVEPTSARNALSAHLHEKRFALCLRSNMRKDDSAFRLRSNRRVLWWYP